MAEPYGVLHIIDTLEAGGQERVAVNLVNHLPRERCQVFLCTTRKNGPLADKVAPDVKRLQLRRRHRFDLQAIKRLIDFIRKHDIQILHPHGPSLFVAVVASLFVPFPAVIWHVHRGGLATGALNIWPYRLVASRIKGVIAVNQALADWTCRTLHVDPKRVRYLPNFIWNPGTAKSQEKAILHGEEGYRIVCLANILPPKDHTTLFSAMALVIQQVPRSHLILVGSASEDAYIMDLQKVIARFQLEKYITFLGHRDDVMGILRACDIGVLSSISEGFPMTLLEYGMAALPTVATQVGQCPEVLDYGRAGILVQPASPTQLAEALVKLLQSPDRREALGKQLNNHVNEKFNQHHILERICLCYESILDEDKDAIPSALRR